MVRRIFILLLLMVGMCLYIPFNINGKNGKVSGSVGVVYAQEEDEEFEDEDFEDEEFGEEGEEGKSSSSVESTLASELTQKKEEFLRTLEKKDPFEPLIKRRRRRRMIYKPRVIKPVKPVEPQKPIIPPVIIQVKGIVGNESNRVALINFEGEDIIVRKGQTVKGKFQVRDIEKDRVRIYSFSEGIIKSFELKRAF